MSITVVGASPAGLSTVRALRAQGYDGEIVVATGASPRREGTPVAAAAAS